MGVEDENKEEENEQVIPFERVKVVFSDEHGYKVLYKGHFYTIRLGDRTEFMIDPEPNDVSAILVSPGTVSLELRQDITLLLGGVITLDRQVPKRFRELQIFHEVREKEYRSLGIKNAHDRTVADEAGYLREYFSEAEQQKNSRFARKYRYERLKEEAKLREEEMKQQAEQETLWAKEEAIRTEENNRRFQLYREAMAQEQERSQWRSKATEAFWGKHQQEKFDVEKLLTENKSIDKKFRKGFLQFLQRLSPGSTAEVDLSNFMRSSEHDNMAEKIRKISGGEPEPGQPGKKIFGGKNMRLWETYIQSLRKAAERGWVYHQKLGQTGAWDEYSFSYPGKDRKILLYPHEKRRSNQLLECYAEAEKILSQENINLDDWAILYLKVEALTGRASVFLPHWILLLHNPEPYPENFPPTSSQKP